MRRTAVWALLAVSVLTAVGVRATLAQSATGVVISEVAYSLDDDWVELHNRGPDAVSLEGWQLIAGSAPRLPVVLSDCVAPGGFLVVPISPGLPDNGDHLHLLRPDGFMSDRMSYGTDSSVCPGLVAAPGHSLQLADLQAPAFACGYVSGAPSPGGSLPIPTATATATASPTATPTVSSDALALTEVFYQGDCSQEWVEITSRSAQPVFMDGWTVGDNHSAQVIALVLEPAASIVVHGYSASPAVGCDGRAYVLSGSCLGNGLADSGDRVVLKDASGRIIDAVSYGEDTSHGIVPAAPPGQSLARLKQPGGDLGPWFPSTAEPGCVQTAPLPTATATSPPAADPTPTAVPPHEQALRLAYLPLAASQAAPAAMPSLLISEVLYQGSTADEGDEFVELRSFTAFSLDLTDHKLGDAEYAGDGEGMYSFPPGTHLAPGGAIVIARCANSFRNRFGRMPDLEFSPGTCIDSPEVRNMMRYTSWGRGSLNLANSGDEVLLLGPDDSIVDAVAFGSGSFGLVSVAGDASAPAPLSLHRAGALDRDDMSLDFGREGPSPGVGLDVPSGPLAPPGPSWSGLTAYWGGLHAHSSYSDGAGPPELAFGRAQAAGLNFYAITDHGHMLREAEWSRLRGAASDATIPGRFLAMAGFEWTHRTEGHLNVLGTTELVSRELPETSDRADFLSWAQQHPEAVLQSNHPARGDSHLGQEPAEGRGSLLILQEVLNANDAGALVQEGPLLESWQNGWLVAPVANSDTHDWLWGSDTAARTGVWASELSERAVLDALQARRVFASEDANLAVGWRCGDDWMGRSTAAVTASCHVYYWDGDREPATVSARGLDGRTLTTWRTESSSEGSFPAPEEGPFWLSVVQDDGDRAWTPPIWRQP